MAKYAGSVGYVTDEETTLGVWSAAESIRQMQGDILRTASTFQGSDKVNSDIVLQHRISLVGDPFSFEHFYDIKWIEYTGIKWKVTMIEVVRPRIILTLGGVWRGK